MPAPQSPKDRYTASRLAQVALPLSDGAGSDQGRLSWYVAGDAGMFKHVHFTADTTAGAPHANVLQLEVPFEIKSGDYTLRIRVSSAATGQRSPDRVVVLNVLRPATYGSEINSEGIYEQNDAGSVIQPDGSRYSSDDDGVVPDFGIDIQVPSLTPSSSQRQTQQFSGRFDPLRPPPELVAELHQYVNEKKFGCWAYLIDDNEAHDRTSPTSRGTLQIYAYCTNFWAAPGAFMDQYGVNYNTGEALRQVPMTPLSCGQRVGTYGSYHVCATRLYGIHPVSKHAERVEIRYHMDYGFVLGETSTMIHKAGHYQVNDLGAFYPKIPIEPSWAVPAVYARGNGYVPFPDGPFRYCPENSPEPCLNQTTRKRLRSILLGAGVPKPAHGFEAHHIKEVMWCGTNDVDNGVFLPSSDTDPNEYDRKAHGKLTDWWSRDHFTPTNPVERCV